MSATTVTPTTTSEQPDYFAYGMALARGSVCPPEPLWRKLAQQLLLELWLDDGAVRDGEELTLDQIKAHAMRVFHELRLAQGDGR
jgi:hypothetical protein